MYGLFGKGANCGLVTRGAVLEGVATCAVVVTGANSAADITKSKAQASSGWLRQQWDMHPGPLPTNLDSFGLATKYFRSIGWRITKENAG